jgi:hypothetical protein
LLAWQDGEELLVIKPLLLGTAKDFAWVVPVPGEPEGGALNGWNASGLFDDLAEVSSSWPVELRPLIPICMLLVWRIIVGFAWRKIPAQRRLLTALLGVLGISIVAGFFVPAMLRGRGSIPNEDGVSVLRSEVLGIYAKGWCFVTSKISEQLEDGQAPDGMIDALVLTFAPPEPVYPFALTATNQ